MSENNLTPEQVAEELKRKMDAAIADAKAAKEIVEAMKADAETDKAELKSALEKLEAATKSAGDLTDELNKMKSAQLTKGAGEQEPQSLRAAIVETLTKSDFAENKIHEVKADTSDFVTPIATAQALPGVAVQRTRQAAVLPTLTPQSVASDKGTISWVEGAYTSNVGYAAEGGTVTADEASATEYTREMAKVSAKIKVTQEVFEDKPAVAAMIESEMYKRTVAWFDRELMAGVGDDTSANKKKIYGLIGQSTAFDAAKAGVKGAITNPSIGDVVDAMKLQAAVVDASTETEIGGYQVNLVFVHPADAMKWRATKDTTNQYIINRLADGTQVMGGLRVIETTGIGVGKLLVMESGLAELWTKRSFEIKVGQEGSDLTNDMKTIVLFLRAQVKVTGVDKKGLIYVSDIDAAITALAPAVTP